MMEPFLLQSLAVPRVWGGRRIQEVFGLEAPVAGGANEGDVGGQPIGERWDVHGSLPVKGGPHAGRKLDELVAEFGAKLTGTWSTGPTFPLLLKWLDCQDWLSIQVHPDDPTARRLTGDPNALGKNECWYFYEVAESSELLHGWSTPPEDLTTLTGKDWLRLARRHHPAVGEWLHVPAGTIHALGPGLLLFEVQQSSDLTYRLYDWDRLGLDGVPRQLHLEEGSYCAGGFELPPDPGPSEGVLGEERVRCPFFLVEEVSGPRAWSADPSSVEIVTCLKGEGRLAWEGSSLSLGLGDSVTIPAVSPGVTLTGSQNLKWARIRLAPPTEKFGA